MLKIGSEFIGGETRIELRYGSSRRRKIASMTQESNFGTVIDRANEITRIKEV